MSEMSLPGVEIKISAPSLNFFCSESMSEMAVIHEVRNLSTFARDLTTLETCKANSVVGVMIKT